MDIIDSFLPVFQALHFLMEFNPSHRRFPVPSVPATDDGTNHNPVPGPSIIERTGRTTTDRAWVNVR